jgi:sugar O-acyltransferase (sialic acid O-acetyltransferase NeuD family)
MADIVLWGAGQIADVARVYIDKHGPDKIVGFTVDAEYKKSDTFAGRPLVAWEELEKFFPPDKVKLLGPLSFRKLNDFRTKRYNEAKERGYQHTNFIHPSCHNYAESIGDNCFILDNCILQPFSRIGNNVMFWTDVHVGHHCVIGDNCFISSCTGFSSNATVGENCIISGRTSVDYGVEIGPRCFIGMGANVHKNLPAESVVRAVNSAKARYTTQRIKHLL